ncbi:ABC transporter permease subunit [Paenibacillus alba]|uniref:ABC transporter permease subunit n=1 Tax=Paenibacillus alba TaxID=1197127 RepID=UPI0015636C3E
MFKSFKSVAIILLFVVVSMSIAKFVQNNQALLEGFGNQSNPYLSGMRFLINVLGFLFVLTHSHDFLNREIENQTIRFLVTKTSKMAIVIGKYLGIFLFWMTCVGISFERVPVRGFQAMLRAPDLDDSQLRLYTCCYIRQIDCSALYAALCSYAWVSSP